ncbi:oligoendopeptidase F [Chloroflexota bacterium]
MTKETVPTRNEIPVEYTWNAPSVYPSVQDWENELVSITESLERIEQFKGRLGENPTVLADALNVRDEIRRRIDTALMYAEMSHSVDKTDQGTASMPGKAQGLYGKALAAISFIEPEILHIGESTITMWTIEENRLEIYQHYFEDLFRKMAHVRTAEVEQILGLLADPFSSVGNTYGMLTSADFIFQPAITIEGDEIDLTQGTIYKLLAMDDREARQTGWENYMDKYLAFKNTLTNNLSTSIKQNVFLKQVRHHDSTLGASLFEQNIPLPVFHNLIDTFRKNLPVWHRYFAIRKKALGLEKLQPYDMLAPLTGQKPIVTFQQSVDWICAGLAPMGEEYVEILRNGCLENRWVDVYPNQGKTAGAFSYGSPGTYPFIVMSYNDNIFSMSTLAHELGHSMHSYLAWETQPVVYGDYSLFVAEVASNFQQAMVRAYLFENEKDPLFQISLIEETMANFYRYFLVMPTLARFELETHERVERGEGFNAETLLELCADLFQEAYGENVYIDRQRAGIMWATFGHLYADYYVYQYATGISGAQALSNRILTGEDGSVEDYLSFIKAGGSQYPVDALKMAGVDLTSPDPVQQTFDVMEGMVDRLETFLS